jgi:hypothetical protein
MTELTDRDRQAERRGAAEVIRRLREMAPYSADPVLIWATAKLLEMTPLDHEVRPTQAIWDDEAGRPVPIVPRILSRGRSRSARAEDPS